VRVRVDHIASTLCSVSSLFAFGILSHCVLCV